MDEHFSPAYLEETEWCYRIRKAGFKLYYYADTYVLHWLGETVHKLSELEKSNLALIWAINYYYFLSKHRSIFSHFAVRLIGFIRTIVAGVWHFLQALMGRRKVSSLSRDLVVLGVHLGLITSAEALGELGILV